ncbi:hypothetical protein [Paracoccus marcusii]|uniref:hypothetical protein n=1 Tax=Paracoccus marcusii TaxID=59779 RepID=UPI0039C8666A
MGGGSGTADGAAVPDGPRDLPLVAMAGARLHLPIRVEGFTDFYASRHHAFNVGACSGAGQRPAAAMGPHAHRL